MLNVIEDPRERAAVLRRAYGLAREILVVSVLKPGGAQPTARPYGDGVVTRRQTFQKEFTQSELAAYVADVLNGQPISAAPGIVLLPKSKSLHRALESTRAEWARGAASQEWLQRKADKAEVREAREECVGEVWSLILELGRPPVEDELGTELRQRISECFGSLSRAVRFAFRTQDGDSYETIRQDRRAELLAELAVRFIRGARRLSSLPQDLQYDVRDLFGSYKQAHTATLHALSQSASIDAVDSAFGEACAKNLAVVSSGGSLVFHSGNVRRLPAVLQVLVGCTRVLLGGDVRSDITKIKSSGPRVSFTAVDDLQGKALPLGRQKVRVNLAKRDVNTVTFPLGRRTPVLVRKSIFMEEEAFDLSEQVATETNLRDRLGLDPQRFWYPNGVLARSMQEEGLVVRGFRILG